MYPTLHVPQSTEETFAAQNPVEDHSEELPIPDGLPSVAGGGPPGPLAAPNGIRSQEARYQPAPPGSHNKPTVGSEEWHKMRKDNHKEGQ